MYDVNNFLVYIIFYFIIKNNFSIFLKLDGDWGLGIGDWGLGVWGPTPTPQPPNPKTQTPKNKKKKKN